MSVERWTDSKLDTGYYGYGSDEWCPEAASHIRALYAELDAKDALIRAGEDEVKDLNRDHLTGSELRALNDKVEALTEECRQWARLHNVQFLPQGTAEERAHRMREIENAEAQLRHLHTKTGGHL